MNAIKILLVDDHEFVRAGFRSLIDYFRGMSVVGEAGSGESAVTQYQQLRPDVVLLDLAMPGMGGEEALSRILSIDPGARVIVLSAHDESPYAKRVIESGAMGYLSKRANPETFQEAIKAVMEGERFIEPTLASRILLGGSSEDELTNLLTTREFEIFLLLAKGLSVNEISLKLDLSPKTVGTHQTHIFQKCKTSNLASLTRLAIRSGYIEA